MNNQDGRQAARGFMVASVPADQADDLLMVINELWQLKQAKWRGTVEYRLDGSGRIVSSSQRSYREIPLTSPCPGGRNSPE